MATRALNSALCCFLFTPTSLASLDRSALAYPPVQKTGAAASNGIIDDAADREEGRQRQAAIEAVARHFSATWEPRGDAPGATVSIHGRRVAVEVATIAQRIDERTDPSRPRLRFDKVALRLIARLQVSLPRFVPDGIAVILTVAAPIRLPAKTTEALEDRIRDCLARRSGPMESREAVCGNQVRIRFVTGVARTVSKVIVFVHNPDSDPDLLLDVTQSLLQQIGAAAGGQAPAGERWLAIASEGGGSRIATYRQIYAALSLATDFAKILMVYPGGRVETLAG
jgi:hypothetical protein